MRNVYEVLKEKGITLPQPPAKGGVYTPVQELGEKFLYCSGCGPDLGNGNTVVGKLGKDLTVEDGQKAAYNCMLNLLANLNEKTGDLNRIKRMDGTDVNIGSYPSVFLSVFKLFPVLSISLIPYVL